MAQTVELPDMFVVEPLLRPHSSLNEVLRERPELDGQRSFAFVRHPFSWYQSFWAFRYANGWDTRNPLDACKAATFQEFIGNVVDRCPGHLSAHLREMTEGVTYIGRFEALRESLIHILSTLGEDFSSEDVYNHPSENVSPRGPEIDGRYTPDLLERLYRAEREAFRAFGYDREVGAPIAHE